MREYLKRLPAGVEFAIVILVAFGYLIYGSIQVALHPSAAASGHHNDASLIVLVVYETVLIAVLSAFLHARGWTLEKIGLTPTLIDTGLGVLLFVVNDIIWIGVWTLTGMVSPETTAAIGATAVVTPHVSVTAAALVSLINPIFEEVFVCGYVVAALKREESPWLAVNVSVAIRLAYHLYQGPLGVLSIIPMGLVSAYWFARTGRLWPVIVAHTVSNLVGLLSVAG